MSSIPVITAIGAYGHFADIEKIDDIKCDICKQVGTNIAIDTSMGEYATLLICEPCVTKVFKGELNEESIRSFSKSNSVCNSNSNAI